MSQETLNGLSQAYDEVKKFANESSRFIRKCTKPDKRGNLDG